MTKKLTEYQNYPTRLNSLSDEERHQWYLVAKERINTMSQDDKDTQRLIAAIRTYEQKMQINEITVVARKIIKEIESPYIKDVCYH